MNYAGISRRPPSNADTNSILKILLQRYLASSDEMKNAESEEKRLQAIQDAVMKVYPGMAADKYKGMALLVRHTGALPSSAMIDEAMNAELLDEVLQQLDPEVANSIRLAPPGEKGEMAGLALSAKAKKEQAEADYNQFVELYNGLPKTSEGPPDWNKIDGETKAKYGILLSKITPGDEADKVIEALWNNLSFGEPNDESKGKSIYGVSLKKGLIYEELAKYENKSYDEIPGVLRMNAKGENIIENADDWADVQGKVRVTPKVMLSVGEIVFADLQRLLPRAGKDPIRNFNWAIDNYAKAFKGDAEAKAKLGDKLYNFMDKYYLPGTSELKEDGLKAKVLEYFDMVDEINLLLEQREE